MGNNCNERVRNLIRENGLRNYEVAKEMNITDSYLSKLLRAPLKPYYEKKVIDAVERIKNKGGDNYGMDKCFSVPVGESEIFRDLFNGNVSERKGNKEGGIMGNEYFVIDTRLGKEPTKAELLHSLQRMSEMLNNMTKTMSELVYKTLAEK